jgi:integrase
MASFKDADETWKFRSTKTTDAKAAQEIADGWEKAALIGKQGKLTPERARSVVQAVVADIMLRSMGQTLEIRTVRAWCKQWLESKRIENEVTTWESYSSTIDVFLTFLGDKADRDLELLQPPDILAFRNYRAANWSAGTAKTSLKTLRACLSSAVQLRIIAMNPASFVQLPKLGESIKRPFATDELRAIFKVAVGEWRGICLAALLTGQRLGTIAWWKVRNLDLERKIISFYPNKTAKKLRELPIPQILFDWFMDNVSADDPEADVFPNAASAERTGHLSNQFHELLVKAGLRTKRTHAGQGKGRSCRRNVAEISFHSFRHTATTGFKAIGTSNAKAMEAIGHESEAVSRVYTHLDAEDLRLDFDKLGKHFATIIAKKV